jgi:hypothetical protein
MMIGRHVLVLGTALAALTAVAVAPASGAASSARRAAPKLGHWTARSNGSEVPGGTPALWTDSKHHVYDVWTRKVNSSTYTFEVNRIASNGKVGGAVDAFSGHHWGSLSFNPSVVGQNGSPLVVFSGAQGSTGDYSLGCIYGALGPTAPWTNQSWSLSSDCVNPVPAAAQNKSGTLAAAWPSGNADVFYRVGVSPSIPASGPDSQISLSSGSVAKRTGMVADTAGSDDFYVAWAQANSTPASKDGYYVKDVTANGSAVKAPGTNTVSVSRLPAAANIAITSTSSHPGVYLAYCVGSTSCKLRLWKVGAKHALSVPGTANPYGVSISAGPSGRIWTSWFDGNTNKVYVTRTNRKVTKFGRVTSYATPCAEDGLLGLSSGSAGRLDIGLECVSNAKLAGAEYLAQAEVPLKISASSTKVRNTSKHTITMMVTDVGDPVSGATVRFNGHKASTNGKGKVSFTLAKHTKTGKYAATASKSDYRSAKVTVTVTS